MTPDQRPSGGLARALGFIRAAREDPDLSARMHALDPEEGLGPVLELAARHGFEITADDLRAAFRVDWGLRYARYSGDS